MYRIRPATIEDSKEIARLAGQLGYSTSPNSMRQRLQRLVNSGADLVLVAEISREELAGWIHALESQHVESDLRAEIGGLVVDERCRRTGIGKELVKQVERWATARGLEQVFVRSQVFRSEAHAFYERIGYARAKTQIVFNKQV